MIYNQENNGGTQSRNTVPLIRLENTLFAIRPTTLQAYNTINYYIF